MKNRQMTLRRFRLAEIAMVAAMLLGLVPAVAIAQEPAADGEFVMPSLWDLAVQGGWFMIPIGIASVITIAFTLERLVGLRRSRLLPGKLLLKLRAIMQESSVDPRRLWDICEEHSSPLANIAKAAVLKTGRSQPEVEKAVEDAVSRETGLMTRNLRPVNVVASISPLLGLLGTVQGMIMAFMVTSTTTSTGATKAQELAHGIYTALVTTFAGLSVAVISVVLANFLEGRIERILRQLEEIFLDLLPRLERYEGKIRIVENSTSEEPGIRVKTLQAQAQATVPSTETEAARGSRLAGNAIRPRSARSSQTGAPQSMVDDGNVSLDEEPVSAMDGTSGAVKSRTTLRSNFDG